MFTASGKLFAPPGGIVTGQKGGEIVEFDFRQLTALIIAIYGSRAAFAKKAGISKGTLSMKLNNRSRISMAEIYLWCELLFIDPQDIGVYFFKQKVR